MEIVDPKSIKKIAEARELVGDIQRRLYKCEESLDDLARAVEIAMVSGQYQLLLGFLQNARVQLEDRLTLPELSQEELDRPITIIEDDRKHETGQPA